MAAFTISNAPPRFPEGTSVSVYAYPPGTRVDETVAPAANNLGSSVTSATVTSGALAFTGLADNTRYLAYAQVSGVHRYVAFYTAVSAVLVGSELGYAEITAPFSTTNTAATDIPGLQITVQVGTRPIELRFHTDNINESASLGGSIMLVEDGTAKGQMCSQGAIVSPVQASRRLNPSSGSHTYKVQTRQGAAGTIAVAAGDGTGTNAGPAYLQAIQL